MKKRERPRIQSFSVPPDKKHVLDWIDEMAKRERNSKSRVIIRCVEYYYRKKWPGNPQPPLLSSIKPEFVRDEALKEARLRQVMVFLRYKARLSYGQIAKIVGRSYKFVYNHCKGMDPDLYPNFDNRKLKGKKKLDYNFERNLVKYQERFEAFVNGRIKTLDEAFRW